MSGRATELAELYLAAGRPSVAEHVFTTERGRTILRQNWRRRVWIPALAAAFPCPACRGTGDVDERPCAACAGHGTSDYFRPYDLRHTCATLLIYEGRTVNEVAEQLGHADPGFTARTYSHVFKDARARRGVVIEDAIRTARQAVVGAGRLG